jgi:hypothetical protein
LKHSHSIADYFALLDEPRRPWLEAEELKAKVLALTAAVHPDRAHQAGESERQAANQRCAELNAAYLCLREPRERLRHLLELERGENIQDLQDISAAKMDLFTEVCRLCREADSLVANNPSASSPVLKAQRFEKAVALTDRLNSLLETLNGQREKLIVQLKNLNMAWETAPPVGTPARVHVLPCSRLEQLYREFSFLTRWAEQLRERIVQLSS